MSKYIPLRSVFKEKLRQENVKRLKALKEKEETSKEVK